MYFTIHTSSSTNILYVYNGTSRYPLHFGSTTPRPSSLNLRISSSQRPRTLCDTIFQLLFLSSPMVIVYLEFNKCQQLFWKFLVNSIFLHKKSIKYYIFCNTTNELGPIVRVISSIDAFPIV